MDTGPPIHFVIVNFWTQSTDRGAPNVQVCTNFDGFNKADFAPNGHVREEKRFKVCQDGMSTAD